MFDSTTHGLAWLGLTGPRSAYHLCPFGGDPISRLLGRWQSARIGPKLKSFLGLNAGMAEKAFDQIFFTDGVLEDLLHR